MAQVDEAVKRAKERLLKKAATVKRVFETADGKALLRVLQEEFLTKLDGATEKDVIFNAGRADVVAYLMSLDRLEG